ncbi:MAG: alpha/beta fold hydrolase [Planctomycetota bacterium]
MAIQDDFFLTNLELRDSNALGEEAAGLSHASMKGMLLLTVLELAARGVPKGAVTVLHNAGDTGERYKALAVALAEAGFAVALPDLRGHGRSEGPRGHSNGLREIERDVQEIQDHLAYRIPDDPKVLIGIGLGANYAAHFAAAKPGALAGLVLVSPLFTPRFERPAPPSGLRKLMGKKPQPTDEGTIPWQGAELMTNAPEASAFEANPLTHAVITLRAIEEAERAAREALPRIGKLGVPTLVLCGGDDTLSDAARAAAVEGGEVEVRVLPGLRHDLLHEPGAPEIIAHIVAWIGQRAGAVGPI